MLQNTSATVTVEDVYGSPVETLQRNLTGRQEFTQFRPVRGTEMFMKLDGTVIAHNPTSTHRFGGPRLIVENRRRRIVTYTETGTVRNATASDFWMDDEGRVQSTPTNTPVSIVTRNEQFAAE